MNIQELKKKRKIRRKKHIRKTVYGSAERLRLTVYKSGKHLYAQLINDEEGKTLVSASTVDKELRNEIKPEMNKVQQSKLVGDLLAKRALSNNIKSVSFDRNGFIYRGRVKALAEAARKGGLEF